MATGQDIYLLNVKPMIVGMFQCILYLYALIKAKERQRGEGGTVHSESVAKQTKQTRAERVTINFLC